MRVVYKLAFEHGPFGKEAGVQMEKVLSAKRRVGIAIGRMDALSAPKRLHAKPKY